MKNIVHEGGPGSVMPWTNNTGNAVAAGALVIAITSGPTEPV